MVGLEVTASHVCNLNSFYTLIHCKFDHCKAVCSVGCFNGGNCTAPGVCTCPSGWTGSNCRQGTYVCSYDLKCI